MIQAFKHSILTWLGILGGALTLLSNLQDIVDLAKWADWLVVKWSELITPLIVGMIGLLRIRVTNNASSMIAMAIFVSVIAIGSRTEVLFKKENSKHPVKWDNILNKRIALSLILYATQEIFIYAASYNNIIGSSFLWSPTVFIAGCLLLYCGAIIVGLKGWPLWTSVTVAISMLGFSYIFGHSLKTMNDPNISETLSTIIASISVISCGFIVVGIAPPAAFTRRIIFLDIGIVIIILLSQISRAVNSISI